MTLKIVAIAAASALTSLVAVPAQAQSLGTILDIVTEGSAMINNTSYDPCRIYGGVSHVECRVRHTRSKIRRLEMVRNRITAERQVAARAHNRALPDDVATARSHYPNRRGYSPLALQSCAQGVRSSCSIVELEPAAAKALMESMR